MLRAPHLALDKGEIHFQSQAFRDFSTPSPWRDRTHLARLAVQFFLRPRLVHAFSQDVPLPGTPHPAPKSCSAVQPNLGLSPQKAPLFLPVGLAPAPISFQSTLAIPFPTMCWNCLFSHWTPLCTSRAMWKWVPCLFLTFIIFSKMLRDRMKSVSSFFSGHLEKTHCFSPCPHPPKCLQSVFLTCWPIYVQR